jgi:predicted O-linked N-acetylglucosamine transferase (SPINDLY family)
MSNPPFGTFSSGNRLPPDPFQQAVALHQRGDLNEARRLYRLVLRQKPNHFDALHLLGVLEAQRGEPDKAEELIRKALRFNPRSAEAYSNLGNIQRDRKKFKDALASYAKALEIRPDYANALNNQGTALIAVQQFAAALASFERAIARDPTFVGALYNRGVALVHLRRFPDALAAFDRVLEVRGDFREARADRAGVLMELGRAEEALAAYDAMVRAGFASALVFYNRGLALLRLKRFDDALKSFERVLQVDPQHPGALTNSGNALLELGRAHEALASFDKALAAEPAHADALNSRGAALSDLGRLEEALASYERAVALKPDSADAQTNRGVTLQKLKRHAEAIAAYERVLALEPGYKYALGRLVSAKMYACDWAGLPEQIAHLRAQAREGKFAANPFVLLACSPDEAEQLACARTFTADKYPSAQQPLGRADRRPREKIRLAYVSGEFREQATSYLIAELFERHDRSRFELVGVATGSNDNSPMRKRIEAAFDRFIDGAALSDRALAETIARAEVDIAVNLNGYFGIERTGVFALRPCPIQVNYLGFPGTMGAGYIDYIIADEVVIPAERRSLYAEKVVYLPDSYQVNDSTRPIAAATPSRSEAGLPENGFVFCCFNSNHKILPATFDVWCALLREIEGSALWLVEGNAAARDNLRREAAARAIAPERLVFAPHLPLPEHLARHRLADLFLDTLPHNAHTTASDALWAGLPVVTCRGETFAGRVAASLLRALELDELITDSAAQYEALALRLARDAALLGAITAKLKRNRDTAALFDTARYTRHIEAAYATMWERHRRGEAPASFAVGDSASAR